ncbi:MAG: polymer-forming cytoskeletal protein [Candidatus Aminicenantes bacterium]|nr:polymer-forming cytoskeletal protein [Candidatus Aminicenantes bacterium]
MRLNGDRSVIGSSITIRGEVSGSQDLVIKGCVEGQLSLTGGNLTVGKEGRIKADLQARVIQVDGFVDGLLRGEEQILLSETGRVRGKLIAPRVILKEGSNFKGTVDMGNRMQDSAE